MLERIFGETRYKFTHIYENCITTICNKINLTYEFYYKQPKQLI